MDDNTAYPGDAAEIRDLIRDAMKPHLDRGEGSDTGGGAGSADLWLRIDGMEYLVTVHAGKPYKPRPEDEAMPYGSSPAVTTH